MLRLYRLILLGACDLLKMAFPDPLSNSTVKPSGQREGCGNARGAIGGLCDGEGAVPICTCSRKPGLICRWRRPTKLLEGEVGGCGFPGANGDFLLLRAKSLGPRMQRVFARR